MNIVQIDAKLIKFNKKIFNCAIGLNGFSNDKVEGDKKTPIGCFKLKEVYYRKDKISKPITKLPIFEITKNMLWSDDINDVNYNKLVVHDLSYPYKYSHEKLYREDDLYDVVINTSYNEACEKGKGSAIFIHNKFGRYTHGCLALNLNDLLYILKKADLNSYWIVL